MRYSAWIGLLAVVAVVIACCSTWIYIPSVNLTIGGLFASGPQNFGKPGLMNIVFSTAAAIFFLLPKVWAKRSNIFVCAFNFAWAVRNYILLSRCYMGDCPVKQTGLYALVTAAAVMLLMAFLPDTDVKQEKK